MTDPFENYPEWKTDPSNPIIFAITAEQMWHFMDAQDYAPLTREEWAELPHAFLDYYPFLDEALSVLRPNHRDRVVSVYDVL